VASVSFDHLVGAGAQRGQSTANGGAAAAPPINAMPPSHKCPDPHIVSQRSRSWNIPEVRPIALGGPQSSLSSARLLAPSQSSYVASSSHWVDGFWPEEEGPSCCDFQL